MSKLIALRNKLDKKLFNLNSLGSTINIVKVTKTNGTFGGYDGTDETEGTSTNVIAVPYNRTKSSLSYNPYGTMEEGESMLAFRYDTDIDRDDEVDILGQKLYVKEVKPIPLNDGVAVIICKVTSNI